MLMWETQLFTVSGKGCYMEAVMESYFHMSISYKNGPSLAYYARRAYMDT